MNFTDIEPSLRNAAANSNCMYYGLPYPPGACAGVTTWNAAATTPCVTYNNYGEQRSGICDPNQYCYYSGAGLGWFETGEIAVVVCCSLRIGAAAVLARQPGPAGGGFGACFVAISHRRAHSMCCLFTAGAAPASAPLPLALRLLCLACRCSTPPPPCAGCSPPGRCRDAPLFLRDRSPLAAAARPHTNNTRTSNTPPLPAPHPTDVTYGQVTNEVNSILQSFLSNSAIDNLQALNAYYDTTSMSAYASACLVKLALLQQKVFLGAPDGSISEINQLARSCAQWMQVKGGEGG